MGNVAAAARSAIADIGSRSDQKTPKTPIGKSATYQSMGLSPTSMAPIGDVKRLLDKDNALSAVGYYETDDPIRKQHLLKGATFVYGFFEKLGYWGYTEYDEEYDMLVLQRLPCEVVTTKERRYIVYIMTDTSKDPQRLTRLLQLADADGDVDMMQFAGSPQRYEQYLRYIMRFFNQDTAKGFARDMLRIHHHLCIQKWENCYYVAATDLLDDQISRDLILKGDDNGKVTDKTQLARHHMSGNDVFDFVVNNSGGWGSDILLRIFGGNEFTLLYRYDANDIMHKYDDSLANLIMQNGPVYLSYEIGDLQKWANPETFASGIPCFDSFNSPPDFICVEEVDGENEWARSQMQRPWERTELESIPSMASTCTSPSDIAAVPSGNEDPQEDSSPLTFRHAARKLFKDVERSSSINATSDLNPDDVETPRGGRSTSQPIDPPGVHGDFLQELTEDQKTEERHASVCIGFFIDKYGNYWYLIRNSWEDLPLFCVSPQCIRSARPLAMCFKHSLRQLPLTNAIRTHNSYVSCASPLGDGGSPVKKATHL